MAQPCVVTGCARAGCTARWVACTFLAWAGAAPAADPLRTRTQDAAAALRLGLRDDLPASRCRAIQQVQTYLNELAAAKQDYKSATRTGGDDARRERVMRTLTEFYALPGLIHDTLLAACADSSADVRLAAVEAVDPDRFDSSAGLPVFLRLLRDPDDRVRVRAVYRLGELRGEAGKGVPELVRLLRESKKTEMTVNVIAALGRVGGAAKEATPVVAGYVHPPHPKNVRWEAVCALAKIGEADPNAAGALIELLRDPPPDELIATVVYELYRCEANAIPAAPLLILLR